MALLPCGFSALRIDDFQISEVFACLFKPPPSGIRLPGWLSLRNTTGPKGGRGERVENATADRQLSRARGSAFNTVAANASRTRLLIDSYRRQADPRHRTTYRNNLGW